jgi:glycosyltransferase involved in cell wall biosynthesis
MKNRLSILIPAYNDECYLLVNVLHQQAENFKTNHDLLYEIIVAEDGTTDKIILNHNTKITELSNCRHIIKQINIGRSSIRNFLAHEARYEWLIFIDCGMGIVSTQFIAKYLMCSYDGVISGGCSVGNNRKLHNNLRYKYERKSESSHSVDKRKTNPYLDFRTSNFMIRKDIIIEHPFDSNLKTYGYEDVLFGKMLKDNNIIINHINNPLVFENYDNNIKFINKTEESLQTLYNLRNELDEYSHLIKFTKKLNKLHIMFLFKIFHYIFGKIERKNLTGNRPVLFLYNIYKLGYYVSLK